MEQRARDKESGEDPEHEACQSRNGTDASVSTGRLSIAQMLNAEDARHKTAAPRKVTIGHSGASHLPAKTR